MEIIPAIDLKSGRVVRLTRGEKDLETIYSTRPTEILKQWEDEGARIIHVVDLDGAFRGGSQNLRAIKRMIKAARAKIQMGGGLRTLKAVEEVIRAGVFRAVVGTKALDPKFISQCVSRFGRQIAVGLDLRQGVIQTHGWQSGAAAHNLKEKCLDLERAGIGTVIVTDVHRDGTLTGPNLDLIGEVLEMTRMDVIASGGVSDLEHLAQMSRIKAPNFKGVIIGKALYEKRFSLGDAIRRFQTC